MYRALRAAAYIHSDLHAAALSFKFHARLLAEALHYLALVVACSRSILAQAHHCDDHMTVVITDCDDLAQVIEKALKKLKLDAMIIQQGRLSDNKASVNKDDLLSMVRYGAEMVFSGGGGTITDEDIDAIIAKVSSQLYNYFYCMLSACNLLSAQQV